MLWSPPKLCVCVCVCVCGGGWVGWELGGMMFYCLCLLTIILNNGSWYNVMLCGGGVRCWCHNDVD